jgi:hypothetical protein
VELRAPALDLTSQIFKINVSGERRHLSFNGSIESRRVSVPAGGTSRSVL